MDEERKMIETSLGFLQEIVDDLDDAVYNFLITDKNTRLLRCFSNIKVLPPHFQLMTSWDEKDMGHTAISLALKEKKLSYVYSKNHTDPRLKQYFSIAAPFYDGKGQIMGCLAFLGSNDESINMAKGMVKACVENIESRIRAQLTLKDLEMKNQFEKAIIKSIHDGFLVLHPDGVITHANSKAASLLGVELDKLIGQRLSDIVKSKLKVLKVFETGKAIIDEETFIKLPQKTLHIIKTAVPVHNDMGEVVAVIDNFKEIKEIRNLVNQMVGARASFTFDDIIYNSKEMAETIRLAQKATKGTLSVLIQGESGTGKELIAHAIHNASTRRNGPFVIIDCASIPRELVESELFGYVEGSFTGARRGGRPGKFELANGGTVFLDEIGEIPLEVQAKFLRVLQNHVIVRVGGSETIPVDIRVIAATNRNLYEEVKQRNFREDLFYRLNVLTINIPPLRERSEDILVLAKYFLEKYMVKLEKRNLVFSEEALKLLTKYHWPGNVRELENAIVRAVNLSDGIILPEHLPITYQNISLNKPIETFPYLSYEELEKKNILEALKAHKGNKAQAAKALGIARSTLYKKMQYFNLNKN